MEQYYTKEQVSEKLGIAQSTVYVLAKKKIIEVETLPPGVARTKRYTKDSVDAYADRLKVDKKGLTVAEFAKSQKLSPQRVYQVIKKQGLQLEKVHIGKRKSQLLSKEHQQLLIKELQHKKHKGTKTDFYYSAENIALFQLFKDAEQISYRVARNEAGEWGFHLPVIHTFMPFAQVMTERQLQPVHELHQPLITSSVYADFSFSLTNPKTYEVIDLLYQTVGIENMHLKQQETTVEIAVKALTFDISDEHIDLDYLNTNCSNAVIELSEGELRMQVNDKSVTVLLESDIYEAVKQQVKDDNSSFTELINAVLREKFL